MIAGISLLAISNSYTTDPTLGFTSSVVNVSPLDLTKIITMPWCPKTIYSVTSVQSVTSFNYQVGLTTTFPIDSFIISAPICGSDPFSVTYQGNFSTGTIIDPLVDFLSISSSTGAISIKNTAPLGTETIKVIGTVLNVHSAI